MDTHTVDEVDAPTLDTLGNAGQHEAHFQGSSRFFRDLHDFKEAAMPVLLQDVTLNTSCLTELKAIANVDNSTDSDSSDVDTTSRTLAVVSCRKCSQDCVLACSGNKAMGYSELYMSAGLCRHMASFVAHLMQRQSSITSFSSTAAAAELLLSSPSMEGRWHIKMRLHLMAFNPATAADPSTGSLNAATTAPNTPSDPAASTSAIIPKIVAEAAVPSQSASEASNQHLRPATTQLQDTEEGQQQLLKQCSADDDAELVLSWAAAFIQEVFGLPDQPALSQVEVTVLPRLQQGLYHQLVDSAGAALCLVCHQPSSSSSARITMVYTPPEHRGRGWAKVAVSSLVKMLKVEHGIDQLCLFADQDRPAKKLYQALGFCPVTEVQIVKRLDPSLDQDSPSEAPQEREAEAVA